MSTTDCGRWADELVELARVQAASPRELRAHLGECAACAARWTSERNLSAYLQNARESAAATRPTPGGREEILRQFAAERRRRVQQPLHWALAAAAMLLLTIGAASLWRLGGARGNVAADEPDGQAAIEALTGAGGEFVDVPYAPPLAQGEFVQVIHTNLEPMELARLGVYVEAPDAGAVPADVLIGEDGLPRAVRVSEESLY